MQVAAKDVKVGDTITATYEGIDTTLTVARIVSHSDRLWFETAEGGQFTPLPDDMVTTERVLPTTPGSVVYNVVSSDPHRHYSGGVNLGTAILMDDMTWFTQGWTYMYHGEIESWTETP